jgi:hypothetical protein
MHDATDAAAKAVNFEDIGSNPPMGAEKRTDEDLINV